MRHAAALAMRDLFSPSSDLLLNTAEVQTRGRNLPNQFDQTRLDLSQKSRTSRLAWRGQFSPDLVSYFLEELSSPGDVVLDPFCGSGTVLFESAERGLNSVGADVNPAAYLLARIASYSSVSLQERTRLIDRARSYLLNTSNGGSHKSFLLGEDKADEAEIKQIFHNAPKEIRPILSVACMIQWGDKPPGSLPIKGLHSLERVLFSMPYTKTLSKAILADARSLPLNEREISLVITSPPYINVFNYHQNYRPTMETLGWSPLGAARSEIGANRKHRQNRFLTAIQYCLDMEQAFAEISRVLNGSGRMVLVVGRESNILGCAFKNASLLRNILISSKVFVIERAAERSFINRFGATIYEDILIVSKRNEKYHFGEARGLAVEALRHALKSAPAKAQELLQSAVDAALEVEPSPLATQHQNNFDIDQRG